jgi:phosphate butyryltransferase
MSHVFACEMPAFDRLVMVTDSAMNIAPDLEAKAEIILNADYFCEVVGISSPRIACLAAVELLNPQMPMYCWSQTSRRATSLSSPSYMQLRPK